MDYRVLGSYSLRVSSMAFGAWQIGDENYWGAPRQRDYDAVVQAAIDLGITLFDTAEMYGNGESERALGRALRGRRNQVVIASKVNSDHCAPAAVRAACEESLKRLATDYLDLYQVHWPSRTVPFADTHGALERLRDEGKIRAIGVSNFGPQDLDAWMACGDAVSNQIGYNLLFRAPEYEILPACLRHGTGILVYMPLLQGILCGRWAHIEDIPPTRRRTRHFSCERAGTRHGEPGCEALMLNALGALADLARELAMPLPHLAIAWLLARPGISSVIIGGRDIAQLQSNVLAAELSLAPAIVERIEQITSPIKERMGKNADMWLGSAESRIR
ncbi:MAG TPA: aldo/keto reductase [Candidatus Hydrogenedentes bacterium]|nr:aldo/keto reductase [Candidatus Hydrogenedentota bacterium]